METLNFGFIGAGQIAYSSASAVNSHAAGRVLAAQDLNSERLQALQAKTGIERSYAEVDALLADADINAVYIAVPNVYHAPLALKALEAGKHVLLEKPFAMNAQEAEQVVALAQQRGLSFTVGMNQRFAGANLSVQAAALAGEFGELYHGKAYWFRRSGIPKLGTWFGRKALAGGGALYDIGVHMLDLCLFCMQNWEPVAVSGATYCKFGNRGLGEGGWGLSEREHTEFDVEDFATGLIKFRNGATVTLDVSWACHTGDPNRNNVELFGTDGGASCYPARFFKHGSEAGSHQILEGMRRASPYAPDRFHNFINHILGDEPLCATPQQALTVQRILDAIAASCASGREVRIDA